MALGARAFDVLMCLIEQRDRVVSKEELLQRVWPGRVVEENNLTVQVSTLRKLLGPRAVSTVPGLGYRFTASLAEPADAPASHTAAVTDEAALALPDKASLAVLPFANLSGDPGQDYFVDGVVDDIIAALSRVRAFFVIARSSSFTYKGRAVDIKRVGRELGVRYVLEGSFHKAGQRLRISAQLVEAAAGRHVWGDRFEGQLDDIFELQDRIAGNVVAAIEPKLRLAEVERAQSKPTANLHAYDLCLRALPKVVSSSTRLENAEAVAVLKRAIAMDPGYSFAKVLCAWAYAMGRAQGWTTRAEVQEALSLAQEALVDHRDDPNTLAYAAIALAFLGRRHEEALRAVDRALVLNPNSMNVMRSSGFIRAMVGDAGTAIEHFHRAMRLNPLDPEIGYMLSGFGIAYFTAGRYDEALASARKSLLEAPQWLPSHILLTACLAQLERWDEARMAATRLLELMPRLRISRLRVGLPFVDPAFVDRYLNALSAAGIPP